MNKGNYEPGTREATLNEVHNIIQQNPLSNEGIMDTKQEGKTSINEKEVINER